MNVLMLAEVSAARVIGGAERVLREQALGLHRRGHRVQLVVRMPPNDPRNSVQIGDISERRYAVSRQNEAAFVLTSLTGALRAFDRAGQISWPDVVVIHQSLGGLGPMLARRRRVKGWVYLCHSLAHEEYRSRAVVPTGAAARVRLTMNARLRQWCEGMVMRRCRRIVVLSEFMKRRALRAHGLGESRIRIVPGGADPRRFHPPADPMAVRRHLGLPLDGVVILTVRNLVPRMGLEHLIEAVATLEHERKDLLVLMGGEGPLRTSLEGMIKQWHLTEQVRLLGFVEEQRLPEYYQAADLVVMPTLELEGFGLVSVEAMACGTPVLGTPVGALPEVLSRVDPRLLADGVGPECLAKALLRILGRFRDIPGEQTRLGDRSRALIETELNWERHAERFEAVLQEACG